MWGGIGSPFSQPVDYLSDPRIKELSFGRLKKFLKENGATSDDLFLASTKFALVATAEKMGVALEPVLAEVAKSAAATSAASQRGGRNTGRSTPKKKPVAVDWSTTETRPMSTAVSVWKSGFRGSV